MVPILLPYHLDEHVPELQVPLRPELTVERELPEGDAWARMAALYRPLAEQVTELAARGQVPVVQSGDCTASMGVVAGLQHAGLQPSVVWFDGHGDVQTVETTSTGYLGGLPLRIIAGYRPELIGTALALSPVAEEQIVLVEARDLDPPERQYLDTAAIRHIATEDLTADDIPGGPVYLHIDFDVINPDALPGLMIPAEGGPSADTVAAAVRRVVATGRVAAVGLACTWRPDADDPIGHVNAVMTALG